MARIPDTERITRLLESSEGGSVGRREIIEAIGLTDERYEEIANQLVAKKAATKNRGRAGGLRLVTLKAPVTVDEAASERSGVPLERDLYPSFSKYLLEAASKDDVSKSVVLATHQTRAGKWETPDLAEVRVTPFPMVGQWELRVLVYELKRQGGWSVESVLQAATYKDFAHESWLVVPAGSDSDSDPDWAEHFGKRVVEQAGDLGVGLGTFDAEKGVLKKHMTPQRRQVPSLTRQQEWLESVMERLGEGKKKAEISANVRWARAKAESGRD